jgi:hypothetical protein
MRAVVPILILSLLSGCAVASAAKYRGVTEENVAKCNMRACFMGLRDTTVMSTVNNPDGSVVEIYKILKRQGSAGRAVVHGAADVFTLGLWEAVATPIEGAASIEHFNIFEATFKSDGSLVSARLLNAKPPKQTGKAPASAADASVKPL